MQYKKIGLNIEDSDLTISSQELRELSRIPPKWPMSSIVDMEKAIFTISVSEHLSEKTLSIVLSFINVHGKYILIEKLDKISRKYQKITKKQPRWLPLFAAFATSAGIKKWKKLARTSSPLIDSPQNTNETNYSWLKFAPHKLDAKAIEISKNKVPTEEEMIKNYPQYRNRVIFGSSWRSDIMLALSLGINTPGAIVRITGCSYEPSYRVMQNYKSIESAYEGQSILSML